MLHKPNVAAGTKLGIFGDVHIGIHDEPAMRVLIECFEHAGVDLAVANGDIHDCGPVSRHEGKRRLAALESGQLAEEAASGRWIIDWLTTRPTIYGTGNHEAWIDALALQTNTVGTLTVATALGLPTGPDFTVLPHGYQIRIGSLVIEHGDITLGKGTGGIHLAANILRKYPNQTTIVNHFHRQDYAVHTTPDQRGINRSHAAFTLGHVSDSTAHTEYAGRTPNWQQGGAIVDLWGDSGKLRYTVSHVEIHRDRYNRPVAYHAGRVFR